MASSRGLYCSSRSRTPANPATAPPIAPIPAPSDAADGSARTGGLAGGPGVAGLVALAADLAFLAVHTVPVSAVQPGTKLARDAVGQRERIESQNNSALPFILPARFTSVTVPAT
jgi:hypothetical protein